MAERTEITPDPAKMERDPSPRQAYVYMLRCGDGSLYTGWTYDTEKRLVQHREGKGAKYTRARLPVELVYREVYNSKEEAMSREYALKQLTREEKLALIRTAENP